MSQARKSPWRFLQPALLTAFFLAFAYGTWQAGNMRGTAIFLGLASMPTLLRLFFALFERAE